MTSETTEPKAEATRAGNGSVAHQIIGEFIEALETQPRYKEVAGRLAKVVFDGKVNEASLRIALFGELEL
ncbi:MAG: hypothetical protein CVU22_00955 [Betaproteobacteria bacterium HGW-Betaproteobacteria-16]|nr:MAG: hypothetical protein CVU22_00955 [Betaproteobacteria bacterium HGW-Betaproteobacteria-16]